jgi:hypothetical protein
MKWVAVAVASGALAAVTLAACSGDGGGEASWNEAVVFDQDLRAGGFTLVRDCRHPGEHSALDAYTVWVSNDARAAFDALWADPPAGTRLPAGAVVVKEIYDGPDCDPSAVARWVAMKKEPGLDPPNGDWRWQEVTASGDLIVDGPEPACIGCHRGGDEDSCVGYGERNGKDFLCTAE